MDGDLDALAARSQVILPFTNLFRHLAWGGIPRAGKYLTIEIRGPASVSFLVPANPALVGLSFYWQAVVGPPLRSTNLEVTTLTSL